MICKPLAGSVTFLLLATTTTRANDEWIGKIVMPVSIAVLKKGLDDEGRVWHFGTVKSVDSDRVRIRRDNGKEDWAKKTDVVLVDQAVAFFTELIGKNPNDTWLYYMRGRASVEKRLLDSALADMNEAIKRSPNWSPAYECRGNVYFEMNKYDQAIAAYTVAIRLDPKSVEAYGRRGAAHECKKEYDQAISDYTEAIRLYPKSPYGYRVRGYVYLVKKDYEDAVADFNEAIRLNPNDEWAWHAAACVLSACPKAECRNGKKAVEYARKSCQLTGWKKAANLDTLAAAYAEGGQFKEAEKWENKALEDKAWNRANGKEARDRLKLYEQGKPYREQ
jgi:tetratricopeptide (TPR) repeat protein